MAKQQILLVDADSSSARLLEVSLRSAGFTVATADSAENAFSKLEHGTPDLIITDTRLPGTDGFAFVRSLRSRPESAALPVVFLTEQGALEDKLRGLELGVDDYLAKPIFVREIVTRVQLLLARKKQQRVAAEPLARTRFSGVLEDVAVVDLLQTIAISGKSGVASVRRGERQAWLYFERGEIIDAEVGDLRGEEAVYRTITWTTGTFDVEFRPIDRARVIDVPHQGLLMEGLRRVDELGRIAEQLPPEDSILDIDHDALASRLNEIPDELNGILRLIDGKRTLLDLIDASPFDDLSTLTVLSKFYFEGLLLFTSTDEASDAAPASDAVSTSPVAPSEPSASSPAPPSEPDLSSLSSEPAHAAVTTRPPPAPPSPPPATLPATLPAATESAEPVRAAAPAPAPASSSLMTRPTMPAPMEGKLTPKGIVNVGEAPARKAAAHAGPFRVATDAPRRSPIPLPDGYGSHSNGARDELSSYGRRQSRTSLGLAPTNLSDRRGAAPDAAAVALAAVARPAQPEAPTPTRAGAASPAPEPAPRAARERAGAPPVSAAEPPASPAPRGEHGARAAAAAPDGSEAAPSAGAHAHPERDFFAAGDEGRYASEKLHADADELPRPRPAPSAARRARARRGMLIVGGVLALAAVPLVIGTWRRMTARSEAAAPPALGTEPEVALGAPTPAPDSEPAPVAPQAEPTPAPEPAASEPAPAQPAAAPPVARKAAGPAPAAAAAAPPARAKPSAPPAASAPPTPAAPRPRNPRPPSAAAPPASPVPPAAPPVQPAPAPGASSTTSTPPASATAPANDSATSTGSAALPPAEPNPGQSPTPAAPRPPKEKPPTASFPVQ